MKLSLFAVAVTCLGATMAAAQEVPAGSVSEPPVVVPAQPVPPLVKASEAPPAPAQPVADLRDQDLVADGFQLDLGLSLGSGAVSLASYQSSQGLSLINLDTPVGIGYHFGQNTLSLGLSGGTLDIPGGYSQSLVLVTAAAKYRRYLASLRSGNLAPFFQAELAYMLISSTSAQYSSSSQPTIVGLAAKGGAEYLLSRHFGLGGAIGLRYTTIQMLSQSTMSNSPGFSSLLVSGELTASVHL